MVYSNAQWKIDELGVVALDQSYEIDKGSLLAIIQDSNGKIVYDFPLHMASKPWVKIDLFIDIWIKAIDHFGKYLPQKLCAEVQERSILEAHAISAATNDPDNMSFLKDTLPKCYQD